MFIRFLSYDFLVLIFLWLPTYNVLVPLILISPSFFFLKVFSFSLFSMVYGSCCSHETSFTVVVANKFLGLLELKQKQKLQGINLLQHMPVTMLNRDAQEDGERKVKGIYNFVIIAHITHTIYAGIQLRTELFLYHAKIQFVHVIVFASIL